MRRAHSSGCPRSTACWRSQRTPPSPSGTGSAWSQTTFAPSRTWVAVSTASADERSRRSSRSTPRAGCTDRTAKDLAKGQVDRSTAIDGKSAVQQDDLDPTSQFRWCIVGRCVLDRVWIEHDEVGDHTFGEPSPVVETEDARGETRHSVHSSREVQPLPLADPPAEDPGERAVRTR